MAQESISPLMFRRVTSPNLPLIMTQFLGKVDILGAGPGAPELLTLVGQRILAQAEVLIYDALIDDRLLTLPQSNCEFYLMGKRGECSRFLRLRSIRS